MKNYTLDRKIISTYFDGHGVLYHRAKFVEDRTTRCGCRCENMVFVCFFWFLPAQRIRKRGLWYGKVAGWLGGCVTVTHRYCIKTAKPTLKLFRPSASPIILVFF